jgi:hypothetical protein
LVVWDAYPWAVNPHGAFLCAQGIPSRYGKVTVPFGNKKKGMEGTGHAKFKIRPLFTT